MDMQWIAGCLTGMGLTALLACCGTLWWLRRITQIDPENAAVVFEPDGVSILLPKGSLDNVTPTHVVFAAALGAKLAADKEWGSKVLGEAAQWFIGRCKEKTDATN